MYISENINAFEEEELVHKNSNAEGMNFPSCSTYQQNICLIQGVPKKTVLRKIVKLLIK